MTDDYPPDYWPEEPDPDAPHECCYCEYPGDVEATGEPHYGYGDVVNCCICDRQTVVPNDSYGDPFMPFGHFYDGTTIEDLERWDSGLYAIGFDWLEAP